jgi:hypothetical protein
VHLLPFFLQVQEFCRHFVSLQLQTVSCIAVSFETVGATVSVFLGIVGLSDAST